MSAHNRVRMRPQIKDFPAWKQMILEHQRILLERLLTEFPEVVDTHRSKVDRWRLRLRTGTLI